MDVYGKALLDFYKFNREIEPLMLHNSYGASEEMPVDLFFRSYEDMPELEQRALAACKGKILDIGAGVGSHALYLQAKGLEVYALDVSPLAVNIMKQRGLKKSECTDIMHFQKGGYDTLLLLMNGIGLAGAVNKLEPLLLHLKTLLNAGGQILFDSSDIAYLYETEARPELGYYGEIAYQYEYKGEQDKWFDWLFIDRDTLSAIAGPLGFKCELLFEDEHDQYLMRLAL